MKKSLCLYVSDLAPNGTRDLIVCDQYGAIINVVEAAVFGGNLPVRPSRDGYLLIIDLSGDQLTTMKYGDINPDYTLVWKVNRYFLKLHFCISPIDPSGRDRLKEARVDLFRGRMTTAQGHGFPWP